MIAPTFMLAQGSTPTLELQLPIDVSGNSWIIYVTFSQDNAVVMEYTSGGTPTVTPTPPTGSLSVYNLQTNLLLVSMTQADTLRLAPGDVTVQVRIKNSDTGLADTFLPLHGQCVRAEKGGTI